MYSCNDCIISMVSFLLKMFDALAVLGKRIKHLEEE